GDGNVVVGEGTNARFELEAFRWTAAGGMVGLGDLPGLGINSVAYGVSADGGGIVGAGKSEAFRWTAAGGRVGLGGSSEVAYGVSANGLVIVGYGTPASGGTEAFRWTSETGMVGLGGGFALATSGDGCCRGVVPNGDLTSDR